MIENFGAPTLNGVGLNEDGTLKRASGQSVLFYTKTEMHFRAKMDIDPDIEAGRRPPHPTCGKVKVDPKTGLPFREPYEKTTLFVRIETPGDKTPYDGVATDWHKREFQRQYEHYRKGGGIPDGHLITQFEWVPGNLILDLRMMGVHTVEQLAEVTDISCEVMPQLWELRDYAKAWCKINSPEGVSNTVVKLRAEVETLKNKNEELQSKLLGLDGRPIRSAVAPEPISQPEPVRTMEMSVEEFQNGKGKKK